MINLTPEKFPTGRISLEKAMYETKIFIQENGVSLQLRCTLRIDGEEVFCYIPLPVNTEKLINISKDIKDLAEFIELSESEE